MRRAVAVNKTVFVIINIHQASDYTNQTVAVREPFSASHDKLLSDLLQRLQAAIDFFLTMDICVVTSVSYLVRIVDIMVRSVQQIGLPTYIEFLRIRTW